MGVIGIVAALTIPNLNGSTNDMEKVAKLKKVYAELNEAQDRAVAVYGPMDGWYGDIINTTACRTSNAYIGCKIRYFDRITEFMKVITSCRDSTDGNCMANENSKTLSDLDTNGWGTNYHFSSNYNKPQAVLANCASFLIGSLVEPKCNGGDIVSGALHKYCGDILVDIDGPNKGKSVYGIDLF